MVPKFVSRLTMLLLLAPVVMIGGCTETPASPTVSQPFSQTDLAVGSGDAVLIGTTVQVDYTGWLYDPAQTDHKGLEFDSSIGKTPFTFRLGSGQVIRGWDAGVPGMKPGGVRRLVIPPSLAYGSVRSGSIPPNSTLVFDITLLAIQ